MFPPGSHYQDAILNASKCVLVPYIAKSKVQRNKMNLPISWCGNYAIVFRVEGPDRKHWAVRCFMADIADSRAHYADVAAFVARTTLPYFLSFEYHDRGIRVMGRELPIIQMRWAEGANLKSYIESNLSTPATLLALAENWRIMMRTLRQNGVAHGDLQHGNVLVEAGATGPMLRLVDYDSMVLQQSVGKPEAVCGLPGYQHPKRKNVHEKHLMIDDFSSLVIYLSIRALAHDRSLWTKLNVQPREALVFDVGDFTAPHQSAAFKLVKKMPGELGAMAAALEWMCGQPDPRALRSLEDVLVGGASVTGASASAPGAPVPKVAPGSWLPAGGVNAAVPASAGIAGVSAPIPPAAWLPGAGASGASPQQPKGPGPNPSGSSQPSSSTSPVVAPTVPNSAGASGGAWWAGAQPSLPTTSTSVTSSTPTLSGLAGTMVSSGPPSASVIQPATPVTPSVARTGALASASFATGTFVGAAGMALIALLVLLVMYGDYQDQLSAVRRELGDARDEAMSLRQERDEATEGAASSRNQAAAATASAKSAKNTVEALLNAGVLDVRSISLSVAPSGGSFSPMVNGRAAWSSASWLRWDMAVYNYTGLAHDIELSVAIYGCGSPIGACVVDSPDGKGRLAADSGVTTINDMVNVSSYPQGSYYLIILSQGRPVAWAPFSLY